MPERDVTTDERMRLRAVERVRVGVVFLGLSALMAGPALVLSVLDSSGIYVTIDSMWLQLLLQIGAGGGTLLVAVPAYLFLLPARWCARANRMASVWWASIVFVVAMGLLVALVGVATMAGFRRWGYVVQRLLILPPLMVVASMGLLTFGLGQFAHRTRSKLVVGVLVCCALVTLELGVMFGGEATLDVCNWFGWMGPPWLYGLADRVLIGMALVPPLLLVGSVLAFVGAHRLVTQIVKEGECPECGYQLGGLREKGCPECGWGRVREEGRGHEDAQGPGNGVEGGCDGS